MAFITQDNVTLLTGTLAQRPAASTLTQTGTIYVTKDGNGAFSLLAFSNSASNVWEPLGAGSGVSGWSKYVVAPVTGPVALYTSIQAAINDAVADGHGPSAPTTVLVFPGTYTETVTLADGVDVVGITSNPNASDTRINGNIVASGLTSQPVVSGFHIVGNVQITGGSQFLELRSVVIGGSITFSGTSQFLLLEDAEVDASSTDAIHVSGTDISSGVKIVGSILTAPPGHQAYNASTVCRTQILDSEISGDASGVVVTLSSSQDVVSRTIIVGQVSASAAAVAGFEDVDIETIDVPAIVCGGNTIVTFMGGSLNRGGAAGPVVSGTGTGNSFSYDHIVLGVSHFLATGVETTGNAVAAPLSKSSHGPTGSVSIGVADGDVVVLSPTGPVSVTLPPIIQYGDGRVITVKNNGGGTATIGPSGGDTLDTTTAVLVPGAVHGVSVRADVQNLVWDTISKF